MQVKVFWVVTPCNVADGGSKVLWNSGILPQHYMVSQPRNLNCVIYAFSYIWCFIHSEIHKNKIQMEALQGVYIYI